MNDTSKSDTINDISMLDTIQEIVKKNPVAPALQLTDFAQEKGFLLENQKTHTFRKHGTDDYEFQDETTYSYNKGNEALVLSITNRTDSHWITVYDFKSMKFMNCANSLITGEVLHISDLEKGRLDKKALNSKYGFNLK